MMEGGDGEDGDGDDEEQEEEAAAKRRGLGKTTEGRGGGWEGGGRTCFSAKVSRMCS